MRRGRYAMRAGAVCVLFVLSIVGGCGGGSADSGTVSGQILDTSGEPVEGALVTVSSDPVSALTDADGYFDLRVPPGNHTLTVVHGGVVVYTTQIVVVTGVGMQVDPVTVDAADTDGDQLANSVELGGWEILVDEDGVGEAVSRHVSSDPLAQDTDGDGLTDNEEFASRTDPRRADTDGDLLTDLDELKKYKSQPTSVDSDGDACPDGCVIPNPSLFDGYEVMQARTSPVLADTDGDGLSDFAEITGGGLNPRVAELPTINLEVFGDPSVVLVGKVATSTTEATLESRTDETEATASLTAKASFEASQKVGTESEFKGGFPPSGSAKVNTEFEAKQSFSSEASAGFTESSKQEAQQKYEQNQTAEFTSGRVAVAFKVRNTSSRAVKVKDLSVLAYRLRPPAELTRTAAFSVVGLLRPVDEDGDPVFDEVVLAPGGEFSFLAQNANLPVSLVKPLLANPSSLFFEVANFAMEQVDERGETVADFSALAERVHERCGMLIVDFGNGTVERHLIATNLERDPDGSAVGIRLGDVMDEIYGPGNWASEDRDVDPDDPSQGTVRVLARVADTANFEGFPNPEPDPRGALGNVKASGWFVSGATPQFSEKGVPFEEFRLLPGTRINLIYLTDTDGDLVADNQEFFFGTDPKKTESDGDGLTDGEELNQGWEVRFYDNETDYGNRENEIKAFTRNVFSNPLVADTDEDGIDDEAERDAGTDPYVADTDEDGIEDSEDPFPVARPGAVPVPTSGLAVFYPFDDYLTLPSRTLDASGKGLHAVLLAPLNGDGATLDFGLAGIPPPTLGNGVYRYEDRFDRAKRAAFLRPTFDTVLLPAGLQGPALSLVGPTKQFTLACWVRPAELASTGRYPILGLASWSGGLFLVEQGGHARVRFEVPTSSATQVLLDGVDSLMDSQGSWWFCAAVHGTKATGEGYLGLYVRRYGDTVAFVREETLNTGQVVSDPGAGAVRIGVFDSATSLDRNFTGGIDDVRVFARALNDKELDALFGDLP